jgi:excisionase family DNA binding protein
MNKNITQVHGVTPEQLKAEILEGFRLEIQELSKNFTPKEPTVWITRKDASELLGVSLVTIHNWTKDRIIIAYKIGNRVRFKRSDLENILLNSNKKASK